MFTTVNHAIRRRNQLLAASAVFLVLSVAEGFPISAVAAPHGLFFLALIVFGGLFMAMGLREIAPVFLVENVDPWYARRHTLLYLLLTLPFLLTVAVGFIGKTLSDMRREPGWPVAYWLAYMACTLLWIVIIDWPSGLGLSIRRSPRDRGSRSAASQDSWHGPSNCDSEDVD